VTKSSKTWWLKRPSHAKGILPTKRLMGLFLLLLAPITISSIWDYGWRTFFILNSLLFLLSLLDFMILPRRKQIIGKRVVQEEVERGESFPVRFHLKNQSSAPIRFRLIDELPTSFLRPFPIGGEVGGGQEKIISYESTPQLRGDFELGLVFFRYQSLFGLWEKQMSFEQTNKLSVIPDMSEVRGHLASLQKLLLHEGLKIRRSRIGGGEFAQIRNYVIGDDPRKINWRQTGKQAELMTNVYQPEHGKYITILIDCGRPMGVELTKVNRLERSVEAALTVAAVALRQGDYVSVIVFSNKVKAYIPAGKGMAHLQTIIQSIYGIQADSNESNYIQVFDYLERVQKRRSFIMLFSDLSPFLFEETSLFSIQRVKRRHIFLLLGLADPMVNKWIKEEPVDTRTIMIKSAAQREVLRKNKEMKRMHRLGIEMMEVPEEHLATKAVSRYIDIINRGQL
jgi:uncharacterized protein (DUF58 family)